MRYVFIGIGLVFILGGLRGVLTRAPLTWKMGGQRGSYTEFYVDIPSQGSVFLGYVAIALGIALVLVPLIGRTRWWNDFISSPPKYTPPVSTKDPDPSARHTDMIPGRAKFPRSGGAHPKPSASRADVIPPPKPPAPPRGFPRIKRDE